jgi:hypothetical protein
MLRQVKCVLLVEVADLQSSLHSLWFTKANAVPLEQHEPVRHGVGRDGALRGDVACADSVSLDSSRRLLA